MTETNSGPPDADAEGSDQLPVGHRYGHGRMPAFMKLVWLAFLAFGAWYTATFLLSALSTELG
jgi:hypothetical protein